MTQQKQCLKKIRFKFAYVVIIYILAYKIIKQRNILV